jgi:hypothetical protein
VSQSLEPRDDRYIEARVEQYLHQAEARSRPRRGAWATVVLNLGLVSLGLGGTGIIAPLVHGPAALVALAIEWAAIAAIGVSFSLGGRPASALPASPAPPAPAPVAWPQPAAAFAPAPAQRLDSADRLPLGVRVKVEQIRRKAEMLLEHQERFPIGSRQVFVLRRIQAEYLPAAISAHEALSGDDRPMTPDGRTALRVLRDQLDLLDSKLDEIAEDLQRHNADRLLANERFLEVHFGNLPAEDSDLRLQ